MSTDSAMSTEGAKKTKFTFSHPFTRILSTFNRSVHWRAHDVPGAKLPQPPKFINKLMQDGWVVIPNVLNPKECDAVCRGLAAVAAPTAQSIAQIASLVGASAGAASAGAASAGAASAGTAWAGASAAANILQHTHPADAYMNTAPGASSAQAAWTVRQHASVVSVFEQLWQTPDLIVSSEGWLYEPASTTNEGASKPKSISPHISIASGRLAAGEVCINGMVAAAPTSRWCVLTGSHKHMVSCLAQARVNTGTNDWHTLTNAELTWLREQEGVKECRVHMPAGSMLLYLSHAACWLTPPTTATDATDAATLKAVPTTCLVPVCFAPRQWASANDLRARRVLFAKGATTNAWPLFRTRIYSTALSGAHFPKLTALGARLAGFDAPPSEHELRTLAAAALPTFSLKPASPAPPAATRACHTPARQPRATPLTVSSPGRAGLALTHERTVRIGDAKTRQLVADAMLEGRTVHGILEPDHAAGAFHYHNVHDMTYAEKSELGSKLGVGWFAKMLVAEEEQVALGKNAPGCCTWETDDRGNKRCVMARAQAGTPTAQCAALVMSHLVTLPGLAPPRKLSVGAFVNDSVVIEVAPWEEAMVEAEVGSMRAAVAALGVHVEVHRVHDTLDMWDVVPPAVTAMFALRNFVTDRAEWKLAEPLMRVTMGTVGAERKVVEGWGDGKHVAVVCHGCLSRIYDDLEKAVRAACKQPEVTVHVAWDGTTVKSTDGLRAVR